MNKRLYGGLYEEIACDYLIDEGYKILERNWHYSNRGELDIVALDPNRFGEEYLVFIEVKAREESLIASLNALSFHKIKQLRKLAKAYLNFKKLKELETNICFDFIAISRGKLEHLKNVI